MPATATADPITTQVIRFALERIADEMGWTLVRTARSTIIKEVMDITCGVFDARGNTIAQAHHAPMLLTGFEITLREVVRRFPPETLQDGDVIVSNDPYLGGQHVMDLQTFAPVFHQGALRGWVASIAHHSDLGGAAPGGVAGGLNEIYLEGIRMPMIHLYRGYQECRDLFALLRANIRVPDKTLGDIRAQASADFVGIRRFRELLDRYGLATVQASTDALLDGSERRIREALKLVPDGDYAGEDFVDDDGVTDQPIRIKLLIKKRGDRAVIDFTGTSPEVKGNVNCPVATVHAAVYYAFIATLDPHVPPNSGCYRPFELVLPEGSVVNPRPPRACQARTNTSQKVAEAMLRALAVALPDRVTAGSHGQITSCAFSGMHPQSGRRFVYIDIQGGGAGARREKDGRDGQDSHLARFMNTPIEALELENPIRVERYELQQDSGGAGRTRGALGPRRDIRVLTDCTWARYADRQKFPPFGILGGKDGTMGRFVLNPDTPQAAPAKSKGMQALPAGTVVAIHTPGAGGYGDPHERDPQLVLADVRDGKVSAKSARENYGVVIDEKTWTVDAAATKKLRAG